MLHETPPDPCVRETTRHPPPKVPREQTIFLHVNTIPGPETCTHILEFVSRWTHVPVDIALNSDTRSMAIEILLDLASFAPSAEFLREIERLPWVKQAQYLDHGSQKLSLFARGTQGRAGVGKCG